MTCSAEYSISKMLFLSYSKSTENLNMFLAFSPALPAVRISAPGTILAHSSMAKSSNDLHMWGRVVTDLK